MANLLATGATWLASQLKAHASETVQYVRSGETTLSLLATIGQTEFDTEDERGILIKVQSRDFLITTADLDFGEGAVEPQLNDVIKETVGSVVHHYEVLPFGSERQLWRYSDTSRLILRIHTKLMKEE